MRLLGLDFETTGLDTSSELITEIGIVLWEVETKRPLVTLGFFCYTPEHEEKFTPEVCEMMNRVSGITPEILREFGTGTKENLKWLEGYAKKHDAQYIVAHNGSNYDKPLLEAELARHELEATYLRGMHWLDTRTDIPFPTEPDSRKLKHLALDCGFINPFAHRAAFDVLTMMQVLSHYDINAVIELSKIPLITVRALVSYDERQLAKDKRYSWEKLGDRTYSKMWVKRIRENALEAEQKACPFKVARIE